MRGAGTRAAARDRRRLPPVRGDHHRDASQEPGRAAAYGTRYLLAGVWPGEPNDPELTDEKSLVPPEAAASVPVARGGALRGRRRPDDRRGEGPPEAERPLHRRGRPERLDRRPGRL